MAENQSDEFWQQLSFRAMAIFTPSKPITDTELFSGRRQQLRRLFSAVREPGRHAFVYGEAGVGKTSIAYSVQEEQTKGQALNFIRKSAFSSDSFSSLWLGIFKEICMYSEGEGERVIRLSDNYSTELTPNDVVRELGYFNIPTIVIDEFNLIADRNVTKLMAETIKALSDAGTNTTIIIVGIADTIDQLIDGHGSISRCSEEILMPRMSNHEMQLLLESRIQDLKMEIERDAKWNIINLAKGLPALAHSLGKEAVLTALDRRAMRVDTKCVDEAIKTLISGSQSSLRAAYDQSAQTYQPEARFRVVLLACSMAETDENGYFTLSNLNQNFEEFQGKKSEIDTLNKTLRALSGWKRGCIIQRTGTPRNYRYRFTNPAMQPYVIMRSINDGLISETIAERLREADSASKMYENVISDGLA